MSTVIGAVMAKKPKKEAKDRRLNLMVSESWYEQLVEQADRWGMTISQYIRFSCDQQRYRDEDRDRERTNNTEHN